MTVISDPSSGQSNPAPISRLSWDNDATRSITKLPPIVSNPPLPSLPPPPLYEPAPIGVAFSVKDSQVGALPQKQPVDHARTAEEFTYRFGWRGFRPDFIQRFNSPGWMLFFICILVAIQAKLVSGFLNTSLSTIEKVFGLSSLETGVIISTYDGASLLAVLPVTYFGQSGRKPRWLGAGALLISLGCLVFFLPEAFRDPYTWVSEDNLQFCTANSKAEECMDYKCNQRLRFIFMTGTMLIGIGATPVYTLGVAYIDENVPKARSALFLGVFYTVAVAAPALGFVLSGLFLRIPIDFKNWGGDLSSPNWAGAWYVGFLFEALLAMLISFVLLAMPRKIKCNSPPTVETVKQGDLNKSPDYADAQPEKSLKTKVQELPGTLLVLLKNVTFMLLIAHGVSAYFVISGLSTFLPKYFESQFGLSSSDSAFIVGSLAVPAAAIGTLSSGVFLRCKNWPTINVMRFAATIQVLALPLLCFFLLACPKFTLAGLHVSYNDTSHPLPRPGEAGVDFEDTCNKGCWCDFVYFDPVCHYGAQRDVTYFSPCHAGCSSGSLLDCGCLVGNGSGGRVEREICEGGCAVRTPSYFLFFVSLMVASSVSVPQITCLLRVVPDSQRSLALGVQWIFVRLLGTIPGPIVFGKLFDRACLLWNESKACHTTGFCLNYDTSQLGLTVFFCALVPLSLGFVLLVLAIRSFRGRAAAEQSALAALNRKVAIAPAAPDHTLATDNTK